MMDSRQSSNPLAGACEVPCAGGSLRTLLDTAEDFFLVFDLKGRYAHVGGGPADWPEISEKNLLGKTPADILSPAEAEPICKLIREVTADQQPRTLVHQATNSRCTNWYSSHAFPICDPNRRLRGIGCISRNVSALKQIEQQLRESQHQYRVIYEQAPICYQSLDHQGRFLDVNPAWLETLGYSRAEVIGRRFEEFLIDEQRAVFITRFEQFKSLGRVSDVRFTMIARDGSRREVAFEGRVSRDEQGRFLRTHCVFQDITERSQAERQRRDLEAQANRMHKLESLAALAGGIAHDFNNLLVAVMGNADLALRDSKMPDSIRDLVAEIKIASVRAAELTGQMLAFSGKGRFLCSEIRVNDLVDQVLAEVAEEASSRVTFALDLDENLPPIQADGSQIREVIHSLVTNAVEAVDDKPGTVTIRTCARDFNEEQLAAGQFCDDLQPGRYVVIEVEDTGCGMDAGMLERLFDPFFTTKFTGRGLGLAATLGIVRSHYGAIHVRSTPEVGSTFRVLLPAGLPAQRNSKRRAHAPVNNARTILVAEDDPAVRGITRRMLQAQGYHVIVSADGRDAVELFTRHPGQVDLVLLDLVMPVMGGLEALREIRELSSEVRVLLFSGYGQESIAEQVDDPNVIGFLRKPFALADLEGKITAALGPARAQGQPPGDYAPGEVPAESESPQPGS